MEQKDNERNNFNDETEEKDIPLLFSDGDEGKSYGRFKDADALYNSYLRLEAEFTRRSQQLKRLKSICAEHGFDGEGQPLKNPTEANENVADSPEVDGASPKTVTREKTEKEEKAERAESAASFSVPDDVRDKIIKEYLDGVTKGRVPLLKSGGIVPAGRQKISSITRAGNLSLQYFKEH